MDFNVEILQATSKDPIEAFSVYVLIQERFHGVNSKTKLQYVDQMELDVPRVISYDVYTHWIWEQRWDYGRFKQAMFPDARLLNGRDPLDDPERRWAYTVHLWRAFVQYPVCLFWQLTGWLFRSEYLTKRGQMQVWQPTQKFELYNSTPVHLKLELIGGRWLAWDYQTNILYMHQEPTLEAVGIEAAL